MKKTVLLSEKSNVYMMHFGVILYRMGFDVHPFESEKELHNLIASKSPDLIVLDIKISGLDGIGLLEKLKADEKTREVPVVVISDDPAPEAADKCKSLGCSAYMMRPVSLEKLHAILQDIVYKSEGYLRDNLRALLYSKVVLTFSGETHELSTESLSEKGLYVISETPLPLNAEVSVRLDLENERSMNLKGRVIYKNKLSPDGSEVPVGLAIKFIEADKDEMLVISEYVRGLLTIPDAPVE